MIEDNLFARLEKLFDVTLLADSRVLVLGCGSEGVMVALQLVMSGIRNFTLLDHDILEPENVIRHVCGRSYLGRKKVDALSEVLRDRNPSVLIKTINADLMTHPSLDTEIKNAS